MIIMVELDKNSVLYDKILGCLVGGALGDAIGGATEMMSYEKIESLFSWIDRPLPTGNTPDTARFSPGLPAGAFTDDTRLKHLLCKAIMIKGGRVTADDLAEIWLEEMEGWYYTPVINAYHKIYLGDSRPRDAGRGCMVSNSTAMSISPVGIINACNPSMAALDAYDVASIIHEGDARDGAVAVAAAVSEAFNPQADVDSILNAALTYLYPKGKMKHLIQQAIALAKEEKEYKSFRKAFHETMLVPFPQDVGSDKPPEGFYDTAEPREAIPATFALLYLAKGKWQKSVEYCANFGRDADTLATMAGGIAGALEGAKVIPQEWIDMIPEANPKAPNQHELASQLGTALLKYLASIQEQISTIKSMA
jgi:ADP-ribosylglycohydrolase